MLILEEEKLQEQITTKLFQCFSKHADKAISQRAEVLKELNVDEEDAWGEAFNILQQHFFKAYIGNERK
eukprot:3771996-Ditylum_brightwellii.AAC.1